LSWASGRRSAERGSGHSLLVVAQPARILAANGRLRGRMVFRGLRSGGRGLGVPLRPNPVRPTPWASDGVPGEGSIPAPLPPPFARLCAPTYDLLRSYVFEPSLVRDSVGACPRHATLRIAAAGAIATMVDSIVLARAVGDKRLSDSLLEAGRQALHHQAAGASAGACPAGSI
jgi:hypothetical protein